MERVRKHHYEVISYDCVCKFAYLVELLTSYQFAKFECSRLPESNFIECRDNTPPSSDLNALKNPGPHRVKCCCLSKAGFRRYEIESVYRRMSKFE